MKRVILSLIVCFCMNAAQGQNGCGTEPLDSASFEEQPWVGNNQYLLDLLDSLGFGNYAPPGINNLNGIPLTGGMDPGAYYWIPVKAWVYNLDDGSGEISPADVEASVRRLNSDFRAAHSPHGQAQHHTLIQFYLTCGISYQNNTAMAINASNNTINNVWDDNYQSGAVNIHFVQEHNDWGGTARMPKKNKTKSFCFAVRRGNMATSTVAHEMGHVLGLEHTHYGRGIGNSSNADAGKCFQESVSRTKTQGVGCVGIHIGKKKCEINGDGLCDTEADPNLFDQVNINSLEYEGGGTDNWGDNWVPNIFNYMSYSPGPLRQYFSPMQIAVMHYWAWGVPTGSYNRLNISNPHVDVFEPDNEQESASLMGVNTAQHHGFHSVKTGNKDNPNINRCETDWVRFVVPINGMRVNVFTTGAPNKPDVNTEIFLYAPNGTTLLAQNDDKDGSTQYSEISEMELNQGTYWIKVVNKGNTDGEYYLYVLECETACCYNDLIGSASSINSATGNFHFGVLNYSPVIEDKGYFGNSVIVDEANFSCNVNAPVGFENLYMYPNPPGGSHLKLTICNDAEINVANGDFIVGDGATRTAEVLFDEGTVLNIGPNGRLLIRNNNKLVIEAGAKLFFEAGAAIILEGAGSVLEIKGVIELGNNALFETSGEGYLLFNSTIEGQVIPFNIIGGNNSSVSFTRTTGNKPKVLEVASGTYIYPDGNLNLFEMKNITVELGTEAYLNLGCPIKLEYCMFKKIPSLEGDYVHGGIKLYGQKDYQNPALGALINHCYFFNAKFGIRSFHNYGNRSVRLLRNNFRFCETGVYTFWHGLYLNSNTFTFCKTSVEAAGFTGNALFEFNQVIGSIQGMRFSGTSSSSVIGGANIFLKSNGVSFTNSETTLMCNKFQQGAWHIGSFDNFKLNLNSSVNPILMPNSEVYGGYNHFDEQFEAIYNAGNGVYDINWGYNVFRNTHYPSSGNSLVTQISNRNTLPTDNSFSENCWIPKNHLPYIPYPPVTDLLAFNQSRHFSLNFTLGYLPYMTGPEILYENVPQCPVNLWRTQLHSEFDPTEPSNQALMAIVSDNVLGNLPLENPTVTVGGGVYMGVSLINATMDGINAAHSGVEDGRAIINTTGLGNLCDLLSNVNQNMNWQDILSIKRHYMVYLANALETEAIEYGSYQHSNFLTSSIYMIDHILTVNNTVNTDTDVRNKNYFQLMMDKTDLYNLFGEYTSALGTLGQINITLGEDEQHLKAAAYCQTSNLKNLKDSAITLLEFTDYITACSTFLDAYYHFFIEEYPVLFDSSDYANLGADSIFVYTPQEPEPEPSGLMLVISPNPADNYLDLAINLYQPGNIEIRVYDKFGILKHLDDLGYKTEDMHPYQINTMSYISDVYYLHVILDGTPYSDIFLVNH